MSSYRPQKGSNRIIRKELNTGEGLKLLWITQLDLIG